MIIGIDATRGNLDYKTGVEWYSYYIIRWLAKIDSENTYILYSNTPLRGGLLDLRKNQYDSSDPDNYTDELYDKNGFQVLKSPHNNNFKCKVLNWPLKNFWTQGRLSLEMLLNHSKQDVFFIPSHVLPFIYHRNTVSTIHDIGFEKYDELYRNDHVAAYKKIILKILNVLIKIFTLGQYSSTRVDYLRWSNRYTIKHSKKVIVVSDFTKKEIKETYPEITRSKEIKVIFNGYNKSLYNRVEDEQTLKGVKKKYGTGNKYIFYVGRIEKKKNIFNLIEAYASMVERNEDIEEKLVLVGAADYGYDDVKYLIKLYDLSSRVIIPGWVEEEDLPKLYSAASLFVFPSKYEGFGIPLLQAMACGVPIAASSAASIPEVVGDAAELFDPEDHKAISRSMEKLLTNKEAANELVTKGMERVKGFSWEKCATEVLECLGGK